MLSFFQVPKGFITWLDYFLSRFFWQGDSEKRKYHLAKWSVVCRPRDQGGLGIHDVEIKNRALLGKWLFKLLSEEMLWKTLLRSKYVGSKAVSQVVWKPGDSHFWAGLMATKNSSFHMGLFLFRMDLRLGSGRINGSDELHSANNIPRCITLWDIKVIH